MVNLGKQLPRLTPRRVFGAVVVAALAVGVLVFFGPQGPYSSFAKADRITLYEGLPHQMYERASREAELKTKPTRLLVGFPSTAIRWFYRPATRRNSGV